MWNKECIHYALERHFGRPESGDTHPASCGLQCLYCSGERRKLQTNFFLPKLQQALTSAFDGSLKVELGPDFVQQMRETTLKKGVWAKVNKSGPLASIDAYTVDFLVLQMIASGLIVCVPDFVRDANKELKGKINVKLATNDNGIGFKFADAASFEGFSACVLEVPEKAVRPELT